MAAIKVSQRRACRCVNSALSSYRFKSKAKDQSALIRRLRDLAVTRVRYGCRLLHMLLNREDWKVNHKRVYRSGPEFVSKALDVWAHERGVKLEFSRPGTHTNNAFTESFNGRMRQECLGQHWVESLDEARRELELRRANYNQQRPHTALVLLTPPEFKKTWKSQCPS